MPHHKMCSNDPLNFGDYDLSLDYPMVKNGENLCKYTYAGWCPTCEKTSPRRRSQSECLEPCKKKPKEMKRYVDNQEFENMDLELDIKDRWYDAKHQKMNQQYDCCRLRSSLSETNEQHYFDCCTRVSRSNLCELPTSYIRNSNICQPSQALSGLKMSDCDKNFVDCLENRVKSFEKTIKYVEYTESPAGLAKDYEKCAKNVRFDEKLKNNDKSGGIQPHFNGINKSNCSDDPKKPKHESKSCSESRRRSRSALDNESKNVNERDKYCQTEFCGYLKDPRTNHLYDCSLNYHTDTYFDKQERYSRGMNLSDLYADEMNVLKEKLNKLRNSAYRNSTSAQMVAESLAAKDKEMEEIKEPVVKEVARVMRRPRAKLIKVRTRGGRMATVKIRRPPTRLNFTPRTPCVESEDIPSDYSDSDESIRETEENHVSDISVDSLIKEKENVVDLAGSGDSILLPIRESLFPNVPPYITFEAFDVDEARDIPIGRKFFKWKLSTITPVLVRKVLSNSGFVMVRSEFTRESNQWLGTWGKHIKSPMFKTLKDSQKLNHFPGTFQLGRKDRLWRNFQRMINSFGHKEFGFLPHTYVLPHELKLLKYNWESKHTGSDWWIIKPPASARGVGIKVINKWTQLPKKTSLVVQRYITNPYLINGSKFDLRLYVLVTSFDPLRVYLYSEGLVRFASVKYSSNPKDIKEKYMHLTNYSINKLSSNYTNNEDAHSTQGHKWTITKLLEYLSEQGVNTDVLWRNLEMLVVKTMIACESPITELCAENMNTRYNCYELFGIDVLLDSKLKPWLLEVNISPSLHSSSPLDEHVKGPMVQTLFNMVQFHLPTRLTTIAKLNVKCYDPKLYTMHSTQKEICKHNKFIYTERRQDYLDAILENLTGDDVRHLIQAEDELRVNDRFKRVFPTASTHKLLEFMEPRYYNRLFDAWETKYEKNRAEGIKKLQGLCRERVHYKGATVAGIQKNGRATSRGLKVASQREISNDSTDASKEISTPTTH